MNAEPVWTWRLWGLADHRLDHWLTGATVLLLAASRFLLLAQGPWEQDETLFARALLGFDLAAHFPHPPAFPLWLALGALVQPLAPSPLAALQLLSSAASILTVWPLAALGRRVAPAPVAAAAAVGAAFIPGVWFHSVRGFASTAAALAALLAASLAAGGLKSRRRTAAFFLLLAAALLIRPILLPSLLLLALAGARALPWRRNFVAGLAAVAILAGVGAILAARGSGWRHLADLTVDHGRRHTRDLVWNENALGRLGWVRGLGGPIPAGATLGAAALGLAVWFRRSRGEALAWVLVMGTGLGQLLLVQNPTHPRYAVPFQLALAPALAGAAGILSTPLGIGALLAAGGGFAWRAAPAVFAQHRSASPVWMAVEEGRSRALDTGAALVIEPSLYPFVSYREALARRRGENPLAGIYLVPSSDDRNVDPRQPPWAARLAEVRNRRGEVGEAPPGGLLDRAPPHPWLVVTDRPQRYEPAAGTVIWESAPVSEALAALSQGRFLTAAVLASPSLPLAGWWEPEHSPEGNSFRWGRSGAKLWVPPAPPGATLLLCLRSFPGPAAIRVTVNGETIATLSGENGEEVVALPGMAPVSGDAALIGFLCDDTGPAAAGDGRPLAIQWLGLTLAGAGIPWEGPVATRQQRAALGMAADGLWGAESFPTGQGCWTAPHARLTIPAGPGLVELLLSAPRPGSPRLRISCRGRTLAEETLSGEQVRPVTLSLAPPCTQQGIAELDLEVFPPYRPAEAGFADTRELGVVLHSLRFEPGARGGLPPQRTNTAVD